HQVLFRLAARLLAVPRGGIRSDSMRISFMKPWMVVGSPRIMARYASRATTSAPITLALNRPDLSLPATWENSVAVAPGQLTVAATPVPSSSTERASVNEFTKAVDA